MDIMNMETFYDITAGDLKDIWETDLDPSETLKLSSDTEMQDWIFERDSKIPAVILHDKLMSDALLGTLPIKAEHSYSMNSDVDSMPNSPGSLNNKIDEMEDECFPAMSMNTLISNSRKPIGAVNLNAGLNVSSLYNMRNSICLDNSTTFQNNLNFKLLNLPSSKQHYLTQQKSSSSSSSSSDLCKSIELPYVSSQNSRTTSSMSSTIDIDETCIKDEPMSPTNSSCPASPTNLSSSCVLNSNIFNIDAPMKNFEYKSSSSSATNSLLKSQQIILSNGAANATSSQRIVIPKVNTKLDSKAQKQHFPLPPTPPSSLPSDDSEGNQSPEYTLLSPMSPINRQKQRQQLLNGSTDNLPGSASPKTSTASMSASQLTHRTTHDKSGLSTGSQSSSSSSSSQSAFGRGYTSTSTRQPIHTPLISSQPKGSTGTLVLTEEEKRTLLAEGYMIPTRLPLTKAEEKSLKKIRRKIKNKISAQESRRKKKEYMDQLERKVEILVSENADYSKRVENLEDSNAKLLNQLHNLQALVNGQKK